MVRASDSSAFQAANFAFFLLQVDEKHSCVVLDSAAGALLCSEGAFSPADVSSQARGRRRERQTLCLFSPGAWAYRPTALSRSLTLGDTVSGAGTQLRRWAPASSYTAVSAEVRHSPSTQHPSQMTLPFHAGSLLDDLVVAEDARADDGMAGDAIEPLTSLADLSTPGWQVRAQSHVAFLR